MQKNIENFRRSNESIDRMGMAWNVRNWEISSSAL